MKETTEEQIKKSIEGGKTLAEVKKEEKIKIPEPEANIRWDKQKGLYKPVEPPKPKKAELVVKNQPDKNKGNLPISDEGIIEITPEMAETIMNGLLETIAFLAPDKFNAPDPKHAKMLKQPAYVVIQRWMPKVNFLQYLPEIVLAVGISTALKDMKKSEVKK